MRYGLRFPPVDPEDMEQEVRLARIEAERLGFDPGLAARDAAAALEKSERRFRGRVRNIEDSGFGLDWVASGNEVRSTPMPARLANVQRGIFLRDLAMLVLSMCGFSSGELATLFDMRKDSVWAALSRTRDLVGLPGRAKESPQDRLDRLQAAIDRKNLDLWFREKNFAFRESIVRRKEAALARRSADLMRREALLSQRKAT